jgi:hypothetical protein
MRLTIDLKLEAPDAAARSKTFTAQIGDHEFSLPDVLVADIAVTQQQATDGGMALTVEALLLDEEA